MLEDDSPEDGNSLEGIRFLIADEDPRNRSVVGLVLGRLGAEVIAAVDGVEAFEVLNKQVRKKEPVDYLIIDIATPRMNAVALLRLLRDHTHFAELPVIVISGPENERDLYECQCLGISHNVAKPLKISSLAYYILDDLRSKSESKSRQAIENAIPDTTRIGYPYEFGRLPSDKKYPLRLSYYRCPFCETTFTAPRLSNRALKPDQNDRLAIGLYSEGMEKNFIEYPLIEIICCPNCVYAADRIGFHRIWTRPTELSDVAGIPTKEWESTYFPMTKKLRKRIEDSLFKRLEIIRSADEDGLSLFKLYPEDITVPRTHQNALVAYNLAKFCTDTLYDYFAGETCSRLQHKGAGYLLKMLYIYGLMAACTTDKQELEELKKKRIQTMFNALQTLLTVNDMDLEVTEERLYCITRRFFLADMLIPFMPVKDERQKLATVRKKALSDMKGALIRARQFKSPEVKVIERFMLPLENRMLDIQKKEKLLRERAAQKKP